jgi:lambda family phage portal protein
MKRSIVDKVVGFFSPVAESKRITARLKTEMNIRAYDAAKSFKTDDWSSASQSNSANAETRGAISPLRNKAREAVRNNAHATKAINTIVSNTVGSGIIPNIKGKNSLQTKRIQQAWKEWGETNLCDANGESNFYSLQALTLMSVVESGETLNVKENDGDSFTIRILESDFIYDVTGLTILEQTGISLNQGVKVDKKGRVTGYLVYKNHPGDFLGTSEQFEIPAANVCHVYRKTRPGQLRGVTWFHSVIRTLEDLSQFEQATLISKKIQACFSVLIKASEGDSTMSATDLQAKRMQENMLEPGSIKYLAPGEEAQMVSPAGTQDYDPFTKAQLRKVASGLGITYEALTSDYSQVNFSSGRMGHLEFRKNVETWRWAMLIPQFCEPAFEHFLQWCRVVKGIPTDGVTCQWVPPSWSMIDPEKEIAATRSAIRAGLTSYPNAVRELGYDPVLLTEEIQASNDDLDSKEIILDSDPRYTTQAGIMQIIPAPIPDNSNTTNNVSTDNSSAAPTQGTNETKNKTVPK